MSKSSLNHRQAKVINLIAQGQSQTQAYQSVYETKNDKVARSASSRMLAKVNVSNELQRVLRKKGIDEGSIADTLHELRTHRDWRAKESFIDRSGKFLGYSEDKPLVSIEQKNQINSIEFTLDES